MPPGPSTVTSRAPASSRAASARRSAVAADEGVALGGQVVADLAHRAPEVARAHHAVGLVGVRRRRERSVAAHAELEELDRLASTPLAGSGRGLDLASLGQRIAERRARGGAEQRLPAAGERHDAGGERLGEAFDLDRLGAARDVVGSVLAQGDRADVQPGAGAERELGERLRGRRARSERRPLRSSNSRKKPSVRSISRPRWRARRSRALRSCSAHTSAARASPKRSTSSVLSTTSVKRRPRSVTCSTL